MRGGVPRVNMDRRPEGSFRPVDVLALVHKQRAQVAACIGELRVDVDRRPVGRLCPIDVPALGLEQGAQEVVRSSSTGRRPRRWEGGRGWGAEGTVLC